MTKDKALKRALEFVASIHPAFICEATHHKKNERHAGNEPCPHVAKQKATYEAIKEALAQPEQEPVAWIGHSGNLAYSKDSFMPSVQHLSKPLYTTPPHRKPLTDDEILADDVLRYHFGLNGGAGPVSKSGRKIVDAIEAKLKEKNNG